MLNGETVNYILKLILALITLSLGFSIGKSQLADLFKRPKPLFTGLFFQMVFLPCIAFAICNLFKLDPLIQLGVMIIAICPGGTTANLLSYLFKANVGLSISLTILNGLLCLITIPFLTNLCILYFGNNTLSISIPYYQIILELLTVIILPGALGILLNHFYSNFARYIQKYLRIILPLLLAGIFAIKFFASPVQGGLSITVQDIKLLIQPLLLLNIVSIFISYGLATFISLNNKDSLTIAIETGLQNTALALVICLTTQSLEVQKPAVIYAAFSFFTTALAVYLIQKKMPSTG